MRGTTADVEKTVDTKILLGVIRSISVVLVTGALAFASKKYVEHHFDVDASSVLYQLGIYALIFVPLLISINPVLKHLKQLQKTDDMTVNKEPFVPFSSKENIVFRRRRTLGFLLILFSVFFSFVIFYSVGEGKGNIYSTLFVDVVFILLMGSWAIREFVYAVVIMDSEILIREISFSGFIKTEIPFKELLSIDVIHVKAGRAAVLNLTGDRKFWIYDNLERFDEAVNQIRAGIH
jgi:hypothetical protein